MGRDECLRRRREQYRARRAAETPQQSDERRARRREYARARRAALSGEERRVINDARRAHRQATAVPPVVNSIELRNCAIDDDRITDKIKEFYTKLQYS